jgi:hypothetical protein
LLLGREIPHRIGADPGLDLDQHQPAAHVGEQVDLARPGPDVSTQDVRAATLEEAGGDRLAE